MTCVYGKRNQEKALPNSSNSDTTALERMFDGGKLVGGAKECNGGRIDERLLLLQFSFLFILCFFSITDFVQMVRTPPSSLPASSPEVSVEQLPQVDHVDDVD